MLADIYEVNFLMLIDRGFEVLPVFRNIPTYHGIKIEDLQRRLAIKCRHTRYSEEWTQYLLN